MLLDFFEPAFFPVKLTCLKLAWMLWQKFLSIVCTEIWQASKSSSQLFGKLIKKNQKHQY
jgi:hypothetical protein